MLQFNDDGLLPPHDYPLTIDQLRGSLLIHGVGGDSPWNHNKRLLLVNNLEILVNQSFIPM